MNELLPCPWCGEIPTLEKSREDEYFVGCQTPDDECPVVLYSGPHATTNAATGAWNRRIRPERAVPWTLALDGALAEAFGPGLQARTVWVQQPDGTGTWSTTYYPGHADEGDVIAFIHRWQARNLDIVDRSTPPACSLIPTRIETHGEEQNQTH